MDAEGTITRAGHAPLAMNDAELASFQRLIRDKTGIVLSQAKRHLLVARLAERMREHGLRRFGDYLDLLQGAGPDQAELASMIHRITTHKTEFFREPHHFAILREEALPAIVAEGRSNARIWCAAASTGEEAWSIAMSVADFAAGRPGFGASILATDIDREVLAVAARAVYPESRFRGRPAAAWRPHVASGRGEFARQVRLRSGLRRMVAFRALNLVEEAWDVRPELDAIFCRNVLIYFAPEQRLAVLERLAGLLRPGGWLFLGHAETLPGEVDGLQPAGRTTWRRADARDRAPAADGFASRWPGARGLVRVQVIAGDVHAAAEPSIVRTLLGSCVATGIFDPVAGVGGMNHFMLPDGAADALPQRFGVHAMELLINRVMSLGGQRGRLQAKVFGGARILQGLRDGAGVAGRNIEFARRFLQVEGIPVLSSRTGGSAALEVYFQTHDGRAFVRTRHGGGAASTAEREFQYLEGLKSGAQTSESGAVEIF